jgi:hypothetical protein
MSKKDYLDSVPTDVQVSSNYQVFTFNSSEELLSWSRKDNESLELSNLVFDAIVECMEDKLDVVIVATLRIEDGAPTMIDVIARKENFNKIISSYVRKLLANENYERLLEVKEITKKWDLEFPE